MPGRTGGSALILIDVQEAFVQIEAAGTPRNNPHALDRIVELLHAFRSAGVSVIHIHHASTEPKSIFRADQPGYVPMPVAQPREGETVFVKNVNSAFIGTNLEAYLRETQVHTLFVAGATTNHCVETTTRMAGNLGFAARLVADACWTFDRHGPDGRLHRAQDIHDMTLANLSGEFAEIVTTPEVIAQISRQNAV